MLDEEKTVVNEADESMTCKETEQIFFQGLIAFGRYMNLPEDYWEKEGIGWK